MPEGDAGDALDACSADGLTGLASHACMKAECVCRFGSTSCAFLFFKFYVPAPVLTPWALLVRRSITPALQRVGTLHEAFTSTEEGAHVNVAAPDEGQRTHFSCATGEILLSEDHDSTKFVGARQVKSKKTDSFKM